MKNNKLADYEATGLTPEEVQELVEKRKRGLLILLPCKVGSLLYILNEGQLIETKVWFFTIDIENNIKIVDDETTTERLLGESAFLSYKEAKGKLLKN